MLRNPAMGHVLYLLFTWAPHRWHLHFQPKEICLKVLIALLNKRINGKPHWHEGQKIKKESNTLAKETTDNQYKLTRSS